MVKGDDYNQNFISYIRKSCYYCCYCSCVTLRGHSLDSETGWTGELWSKTKRKAFKLLIFIGKQIFLNFFFVFNLTFEEKKKVILFRFFFDNGLNFFFFTDIFGSRDFLGGKKAFWILICFGFLFCFGF